VSVIGAEKKSNAIGLVQCSGTKNYKKCRASEMYWPSAFFRKSFTYCSRTYELVGILSAKHGFLLPEDVIEPYDITLNKMSSAGRREWARRTFSQMCNQLDMDKIDDVYFHAGKNYRTDLVIMFVGLGKRVNIPLEGLGIGQQLSWYDGQLGERV
jgi:hypothetical protein